jgi:hypothetical protein
MILLCVASCSNDNFRGDYAINCTDSIVLRLARNNYEVFNVQVDKAYDVISINLNTLNAGKHRTKSRSLVLSDTLEKDICTFNIINEDTLVCQTNFLTWKKNDTITCIKKYRRNLVDVEWRIISQSDLATTKVYFDNNYDLLKRVYYARGGKIDSTVYEKKKSFSYYLRHLLHKH